jgi:hypothetical protein
MTISEIEINSVSDTEEEEIINTMYLKFQFEGCEKIDELIGRMNELVDYLKRLKENNIELVESVSSGWCYFNNDISNI